MLQSVCFVWKTKSCHPLEVKWSSFISNQACQLFLNYHPCVNQSKNLPYESWYWPLNEPCPYLGRWYSLSGRNQLLSIQALMMMQQRLAACWEVIFFFSALLQIINNFVSFIVKILIFLTKRFTHTHTPTPHTHTHSPTFESNFNLFKMNVIGIVGV